MLYIEMGVFGLLRYARLRWCAWVQRAIHQLHFFLFLSACLLHSTPGSRASPPARGYCCFASGAATSIQTRPAVSGHSNIQSKVTNSFI